MNLKSFFTFFLLLVGSSCEVDYILGDLQTNEPECIIVNGILNPEKPIEITFHKLQIKDKKYSYTGLEGVQVILKEGNEKLYDGICNDSILSLDCFPKVNKTYSIEASYINLKAVKSDTQVPPAIKCKSFVRTCDCFVESYIVELNSFEIPPSEKIAMLVFAYELVEKEEKQEEFMRGGLYTKNAFVDKPKSLMISYFQHEEVGSISYGDFLRVKNKNLPLLDDLIFSPTTYFWLFPEIFHDVSEASGDDAYAIPEPVEYKTTVKVKVITASLEYDQFCMSVNEQKSGTISGSDFASAFQPSKVYSNIENGLGIFAGMNETNMFIDIPENESGHD